jgi:SnoaL-like domain
VVSTSPIDQLLAAVDKLDLDAVMELFTADGRLLTADGRRAAGTDGVRELMGSFLSGLRATSHQVTAKWHQDDVWIAEVDATYELQDWLQMKAIPRVFIIRCGERGIADLRVYGAHEHLLSDHGVGRGGLWVGERWIPPL